MCIGSEKVSGDMLGPLVGTILKEEYLLDAYIYGTTTRSVNGLNISKYIRLINNIHKNSLIISIDAAVGRQEEIGTIKLKYEGINAGAALGMNNRINGIGIVGVVAEKKGEVLSNLLEANYCMVERMGRKIASIIYKSINQVEIQ